MNLSEKLSRLARVFRFRRDKVRGEYMAMQSRQIILLTDELRAARATVARLQQENAKLRLTLTEIANNAAEDIERIAHGGGPNVYRFPSRSSGR